MSFSYSTVLLVFGIVATLAAVDLGSPEPNDLLPHSPLNAVSPADVTTWDDVLSSNTLDGATDGAVFDPDNDQMPDVLSAECIADPNNSRRRVRRGGWCVDPETKKGPVPDPQSGSDTENPSPKDPTRNNAGQDSATQNEEGSTRQNNRQSQVTTPNFEPDLDYKIPLKSELMCGDKRYGFSKFPMCDSGQMKLVNGIWIKLNIKVTMYLGVRYASLNHAHPCTFDSHCTFLAPSLSLGGKRKQNTAFLTSDIQGLQPMVVQSRNLSGAVQ